jgi:hypothetical protein
MSEKRITPLGEEKQREEPPRPDEEPASTGDMQEVGALEPAEVPERRDEVEGEAPVHESPGDQNSG